nr:hypothetical protein [Fodinicola acaciae]
MRPLRVKHDRIDLATVDEYALVAVADLGVTDRAAVACLIGHLDLDVLTRHADLQPVEHVGDGFHSLGHDAVAKAFLGRNELHVKLVERNFGVAGVNVVAESA